MSKIYLKIIPKSSSNQIIGWRGDYLTIRLNATPVQGKANKALIEFLSNELDIAKNEITIIAGKTDRIKLLELPDEAIQQLMQKYGNQQ